MKGLACTYRAIWECNRHSLDNSDCRPQIPAVDMRSRPVFVCVFVHLQWSDSSVVPLPSPCELSAGPSGFSAFSHQPVWPTGPNQFGTLHAAWTCFGVSVRYAYVLWCSWCANTKLGQKPHAPHTIRTSQLLQCCSLQINVRKRLNPCNQQRGSSIHFLKLKKKKKKTQSARVACRRKINGSCPICQPEQLCMCVHLWAGVCVGPINVFHPFHQDLSRVFIKGETHYASGYSTSACRSQKWWQKRGSADKRQRESFMARLVITDRDYDA